MRGGPTKKIRQYGFFYFIESAKASLILKCLELKFVLRLYCKKFLLWFSKKWIIVV
jgi:hypothetical protein